MAKVPQFRLPDRLFWSMETSTVGLPAVQKIQHSMIYSSDLNVHPDFRRAVPDANGVKMAILQIPYSTGGSETAASSYRALHGRRRLHQSIRPNGIASGEAFGSGSVS